MQRDPGFPSLQGLGSLGFWDSGILGFCNVLLQVGRCGRAGLVASSLWPHLGWPHVSLGFWDSGILGFWDLESAVTSARCGH